LPEFSLSTHAESAKFHRQAVIDCKIAISLPTRLAATGGFVTISSGRFELLGPDFLEVLIDGSHS
jgi:hypothetical protein